MALGTRGIGLVWAAWFLGRGSSANRAAKDSLSHRKYTERMGIGAGRSMRSAKIRDFFVQVWMVMFNRFREGPRR